MHALDQLKKRVSKQEEGKIEKTKRRQRGKGKRTIES